MGLKCRRLVENSYVSTLPSGLRDTYLNVKTSALYLIVWLSSKMLYCLLVQLGHCLWIRPSSALQPAFL